MVHICIEPYSDETLNSEFAKFPFPLSDFQKYSIEAIHSANHVLVTAHTGSGKTVCAEYAILHYVSLGKKVIYTSPIKALSNQKFSDLKKKFPHISFGILTGDITDNPDADVLIMTTEILRNRLKREKFDNGEQNISKFTIDIEKDLGCVIFDEVHYFSDKFRGVVWEETLMFLPPTIALVMLSASINNPENFAKWIENRYEDQSKKVYLTFTNHRIVPLTHYNYICIGKGEIAYMKEKHKDSYAKFHKHLDQFLLLKNNEISFNIDNIKLINDIKSYIFKNKIHVNQSFAINTLIKKLKEEEMLPAIFFILSRQNIEKYALMIEQNLYEDDSIVSFTIEQKCESILRNGLSNYREFLNLPDYQNMIKLLRKGIAIHHAGILPILREMVEILLSEGLLKVLLCSETFAVGLNMPVKTVVMTSLAKFDGSDNRQLYPSEYLQMAGRAGRRGHDLIGHVIHMNNLFTMPELHEYKLVMNGKPQTLTSKYHMSFDSIMIDSKSSINIDKLTLLSGNSFATIAIKSTVKKLKDDIDKLTLLQSNIIKPVTYDVKIIEEYNEYINSMNNVSLNKRNKMMKQLQKKKDNIKDLDNCLKYQKEKENIVNEISLIEQNILREENIFTDQINNYIEMLIEYEFIQDSKLTELGNIALLIQEVPNIVMSKLIIICDNFKDLNTVDLILLFSVYNNTRLVDNRETLPTTLNLNLVNTLKQLNILHTSIVNQASMRQIVAFEEEINYNMICIEEWLYIDTEEDAIIFLNKIKCEYGLSVGDFSKAAMKIINISLEMTNVANYIHDIELAHKLSTIGTLIEKFIITNQSLYV
jgi:superfamily II RNA helicase